MQKQISNDLITPFVQSNCVGYYGSPITDPVSLSVANNGGRGGPFFVLYERN